MIGSSSGLESRIERPDEWLEFRRTVRAPFRLFCLPHAGGSAAVYANWQRHFGQSVEVVPLQLPGRGRRTMQPASDSLPALAEAATSALSPLFSEGPFAFFGHSMGGLLAFEMAKRLTQCGEHSPSMLLVAASRAPFRPASTFHWNLPYKEFLEHLRSMGGTPEEVFNHPELMGLFLPLLRTDFRAVETYTAIAGEKISCPIHAFGGESDKGATYDKLSEWKLATSGHFSLTMSAGGHFFVIDNVDWLARQIMSRLASLTT